MLYNEVFWVTMKCTKSSLQRSLKCIILILTSCLCKAWAGVWNTVKVSWLWYWDYSKSHPVSCLSHLWHYLFLTSCINTAVRWKQDQVKKKKKINPYSSAICAFSTSTSHKSTSGWTQLCGVSCCHAVGIHPGEKCCSTTTTAAQ